MKCGLTIDFEFEQSFTFSILDKPSRPVAEAFHDCHRPQVLVISILVSPIELMKISFNLAT